MEKTLAFPNHELPEGVSKAPDARRTGGWHRKRTQSYAEDANEEQRRRWVFETPSQVFIDKFSQGLIK